MGSGGIVDKWLVELAIRTAKDDKVVAKTLSLAPRLRDDVGLKKIVLLRGIESEMDEGSVSERMLDALEVAFELDRRQGLDVLESMKVAYCSVAVDCVARFVKSVGGGDVYLKAVERVWRRRIGPLIALNVDLVSEQLESWRDTVESAIWDDNVRDKLFVTNTRYEALVAIKGYLDEAWKIVGPSFLELLASSELGKSLVKAQQQLCLPSISEPSEGEPQRPFDMPGIFNHNAQVLSDPSNLVSCNDQEDVAKILTQNLGDNSKSPADIYHKEVSEASFCAHTVNRHLDENMRLADCGIAEEQNLLQSSSGLARDQSDNVELVHVKSKVAEDATLPLPGVCATNSFVCDDHLKGAGTDFVNELKADLRSSSAQGNLQSLNNSKAHYKDTRKLRVRSKHVGRPNKRPKPVRVNNSEDWDLEGLDTQYHPLPENEVIKVREELKSSSRELQAAVKDPLPDALRVAEAVISDVSRNCIPQGAPAASITDRETPNFQDVEVDRGRDKASTSHSAEVITSNTEGKTMNLRTNKSYERDPRDAAGNASPPETVGDGDNNVQNEGSRHGNRRQRANLWERDASARTYEVTYPFFVMFFLRNDTFHCFLVFLLGQIPIYFGNLYFVI
uniref:Uncharacterized protein n=1 Tax=Kalanchoe fedtschenkoi TaxID=63787 RepID=A0A7N0U3T0_KALFE